MKLITMAPLIRDWHNTPNVHMCTVADFDAFCARKKLRVLNRLVMNGEREQTLLPNVMGYAGVIPAGEKLSVVAAFSARG